MWMMWRHVFYVEDVDDVLAFNNNINVWRMCWPVEDVLACYILMFVFDVSIVDVVNDVIKYKKIDDILHKNFAALSYVFVFV